MKTKTLIAFLLLCSAVHAGGPTFSIWHIDGHHVVDGVTQPYKWQLDRQAEGPLELSVRMVSWPQRASANYMSHIDALQGFSGKPLVLRMDNIGPELDKTIPRVVLTEENWRTSHMCVNRNADGTLNSTNYVSPFAGTAAWSECGSLWASMPWMHKLQQLTSPTEIILRQNNEGRRITFRFLYERSRPYRFNNKGQLAFVDSTTDPASYVTATGEPLTPDWYVISYSLMVRWHTDAVLDTHDLRAKEWVAPRRGTSPLDPQHLEDFEALEIAQYQALYDGFTTNLAEWKGLPFRTVGYGGFDESHQHDTASPPLYVGYWRPKTLTSSTLSGGMVGEYRDWVIAHREACILNEQTRPNAWRELSIGINRNPIYQGAVEGVHDAVDPDSYAGYMTAVSWMLQGREVRLAGWEGYLTTPAQRLFSDADLPMLESIGRPDLLPVTIGDYELAVLRDFARIHQHGTLSRYWDEGVTQFPFSTDNVPGTNRVFATETVIPGETRTLIYAFTPCSAEQLFEIHVGEHVLPHSRKAYYLTNPLEPLPEYVPPEPEPLTLEQRVERLEKAVFGE